MYHRCAGRITWEHALTYKGKQIQERFAIIPLCYEYHLGNALNKERNQWVALNRMSDDDERKYQRANFKQKRNYLNKKFGEVWSENKIYNPQSVSGFPIRESSITAIILERLKLKEEDSSGMEPPDHQI